jgi:hypothetical protein
MRRSIGLVIVGLLLTGTIIWSQRPPQPLARATDDASAAKPAVFSAADNSDPYENYFSGHWCNCWRQTRISPPEVAKILEGALPRSHSPAWGKHKTVDMTGATPQEELLMQAFAGIIAKRVPMWYAINKGDFWYGGSRAFFKDAITGPPLMGIFGGDAQPLAQQVGYHLNIGGQGSGGPMIYGIKRFTNEMNPPYIKGAVIYDGRLCDPNAKIDQPRELLNVVRTIAGVEGALPLTPELYTALTTCTRDAGERGNIPDRAAQLPIIWDTRPNADPKFASVNKNWNLSQYGGNEAEAARAAQTWVFNTEWQYCLRNALCFEPPLGAGGRGNAISDYAAEFALFTFYQGGDTKGDERQMELVLGKAPFNIPVVGTLTDKTGAAADADRVRLLRLFSRFGKYFVDTTGASNVSLHSAERPVDRQTLTPPPAANVAYQPGKLYVAFALTTGNSIGRLETDRPLHWDCASRGTVPVGWAIPLTAADVVPNLLKYYYRTATPNDCFLADMSGMGLINAPVYAAAAADPKAEIAKYLQQTDAYMGYTGTSVLWAEELDKDTQKLFADSLKNLKGMVYGTQAATDYLTGSAYAVESKPVLHTVVDLADSKAALAGLGTRLAKMQPGFALVGIDETQYAPSEDVVQAIADAAKSLPANAVVVRPDQLVALYQSAAHAQRVPTTPPTLLAEWQSRGPALALKAVTSGAIAPDGSFSEWTALGASAIKLACPAPAKSGKANRVDPRDLSAIASVAYDDQYLYLKAHVTDPTLYVDDYNLTAGDGLELIIDARHGRFREPRVTEGVYKLFITPAAGLVTKPTLTLEYPTFDVGLVSMNKHGIEEKIASKRTRDGYDLEAAIPLANFPKVVWQKGTQLAFALAVNGAGRGATAEARLQSVAGDLNRSLLYLQPAVLQ